MIFVKQSLMSPFYKAEGTEVNKTKMGGLSDPIKYVYSQLTIGSVVLFLGCVYGVSTGHDR